MKLNTILRATLLPLVIFATACSPFKQTSSRMQQAEGNRTEYVMSIEKDAQDYLEIIDVRLMNSETKASESATFKVTDEANQTLLNLKGYETFLIIAASSDSELKPDCAIITYKDEIDGDQKSKKIKPLIVPVELEESEE